MPDCIAFVCHIASQPVRDVYNRLRAEAPVDHDVRFLLNSDAASEPAERLIGDGLVQVTLHDLFKLGYPRKCRQENWQMAGNLDLAFLEFARRFPACERIWFVEYDVHWEGNWGVLFEHFRGSEADVLTTTVQPIGDVAHKMKLLSAYPPLEVPPHQDWAPERRLKAFLPICRLSRAARAALDRAYRAGLCGHYEITVPSIAAQAGLSVEDIGGNGPYVRPENRNRFYFARGTTWSHSPGCFVFRPAPRVLPRRNTLWHPVKPDAVPLWHPLRLAGNPVKAVSEWLKPMLWRGLIRLWFATRWRPLVQPER